MASFKNIIQTFVALWSLFTRLFFSVLRYFHRRSAMPVLPITAPRPAATHFTSFNNPSSFKGTMSMLHRPPKAAASSPVMSDFPRTRGMTAMTRSIPLPHSTNDSMVLRSQTFVIAREPLARDPILLRPLPSLDSASDFSIYSTSSVSLPKTPSPPTSPVIPAQVVAQENEYRPCDYAGNYNCTTFTLDAKKLIFKPGAIHKFTPPAGISTTISKDDCNIILEDSPVLKNNPLLQDELEDALDVNLVHEILPNSFGSDSSSFSFLSESISEFGEFDWPLPPGPLFRFKDEINAAADFAETVLQRRMQSPVLPLRAVKRNVTPPCMHVFQDPSSPLSELSEYIEPSTAEVDYNDCSTDYHPSFDISAPHLFSEEIITAAYSRNDRSRALSTILSSLPREELVSISNLPSGTVVSIEPSENKVTYELEHPDTNANVSNSNKNNQVLDAPAKSPCTPAISICPSLSPSTPRSPIKSVPPLLQRKADKHSGPIGDTIALLEVEYKRWKAGFLEPDPHCRFMNDDSEESDHWSDVLIIDSYA